MSCLIEGSSSQWEVVIGVETHCQIISNTKLFSGSSTQYGCEPNSNVSFIDAGYPGVLPRPNVMCIEQALRTSLALGGTINKESFFDRKHYFYPDLPLGYQITQFYKPIMENGSLYIEMPDGLSKSIGIQQLHIEQDAGKLIHDHNSSKTLIDLNRSGIGLMEIVSKPDLCSKEEVAVYINTLRRLVRYLQTCDGNMEEGSMRCDINISVRKPNESLRTKAELKNINSIKFIQQAIDFEIHRQIDIWESGEKVLPETRLFNEKTQETYLLRSKSSAADYCYIRDPDLLPIVLSNSYVEEVENSLPELAYAKKRRFLQKYGLGEYEVDILVSEVEYAQYFEEIVINYAIDPSNYKTLVGLILTNLFGYLNKNSKSFSEKPVSQSHMAELVKLIDTEVISHKIAKEVFEIMCESGTSPADIIKSKGLEQITDVSHIEQIILDLINENPDKMNELKAGKEKIMGWFVGAVMQKTQGKANPKIVNTILRKKVLE